MTFTKIAVAVALSAAAMSAQAVDFDTMTVTGGTFSMAGAGGSFIVANLAPGLDLLSGNNQDVNVSSATTVDTPLFNFGFFGPVGVYLSDTTYSPYGGVAAGGSATAPTASGVFGGSMTADLSAWTAYWNGTNFGQGAVATGTVDALGNYSIGWSKTVEGGAFNGQTGTWTMTGVVAAAPVPEASTYGMMLAGLGLVGGMVARRRKLVA